MQWYSTLLLTFVVHCMAARPCDVDPGKGLPFCDTTKSFDERVKDLVGRLTEDEKLTQFGNGAGGIPRLNIAAYQWWSEALHGVAGSPGVSFGDPVPHATSFPQVITTGATFNKTLWAAIGDAVGTEARAFSNVGHAGLTFWAPNVNIFIDPRWGRGQETPGEDPTVTADYAANFVGNLQGSEKYLRASSCCKHYYVYNMENSEGTDRFHFNANATQQDIADTFLPAFESCVKNGKASSLMCSYNAVNGIPSCANKEILTTIARGSWGFQGYVTGDCGAVDCIQNTHHYTKDPSQTCKVALEAGTDIDCGGFLPKNLKNAISSNIVSMEDVDTALTHLFLVRFRLGQFDPVADQPYMKLSPSDVNTPAHQRLALEAAQQGIVLLKNEGNTLPIKGKPVIAMAGPNHDVTNTMQGNYYGSAPYLISPLQGVESYAGSIQHTRGCDINSPNGAGIAIARNMAATSDVMILVVGLDQSQEAEGRDRTHINLPGLQNQLITEVATGAKGKVIVVVMAGGSVDLTAVRDNPKVAAILWVGYPGQSGGQAIADILFGKVSPSGKLPYTMLPANFTQVSILDEGMRPNPATKNPGRTHRFYTGTPVYKYGAGLSYTSFTYAPSATELRVPFASVAAVVRDGRFKYTFHRSGSPDVAQFAVQVRNTGNVSSGHVVLAFLSPPRPGENGNPLQSVYSFDRVFLQPGEVATVQLNLKVHDLALISANGERTPQAGTWHITVGDLVVPVVVS